MTQSKLLRSARSILIAIAIVVHPAIALAASPPPTQGVRLTPIGTPTWKPTDFHLFAAPIGTAASGYAEFLQTMLALLPPPNHVFNPGLGGVGPGAPHAPPYDTEMGAGVAALGFHEGVRFAVSEFSQGMGIWVAWMNVPAPGTVGSSPDFASGPIIPNALFPIHIEGTNEHNGKAFSFLGQFDVPPLDASVGFPGLDGHSHFPVFFADNADFGPAGAKLRGSYRFRMTMVDQSGSGWLVEAHFALAP